MTPQQSIAHYRITAKIGEGGMGAVYRATDTKLNRDVAIKMLPESFAADADRLARFQREAQVLASLNHPNIAAIYGIEQGAIVMELVEGDDLLGPVPIDTALDYARQIATGLEAAHEKGIIHRDLKPANIKVTPEGVVKLLDFGLAKAADEPPAGAVQNATISPTLSMGTQVGVILGTAAYMSPEQARGKAVDKRADIWAFGVVLFELLTGQHLYGDGETVTDTLAAVVLKEPDWSALPPDTPPRIRALLERCLRKDPKQRLRDIGDARIAIDEPEQATPAAPGSSSLTPAGYRVWLPWAVATCIAGLLVWTLANRSAPPASPPTARFVMEFPEGTREVIGPAAPRIIPSPDGRLLAFPALDNKTGERFLWIRSMASGSEQKLEKTRGANLPFWSPDGQQIGFFAEQMIKIVTVSSGVTQTILEGLPLTEAAGGNGATWNRDGSIVYSPGLRGPLMRIAASGGAPSAVTALDAGRGETGHSWPQFLPDGRHLLYFARSSDPTKSGIYVQEIGSSSRVLALANRSRGAFALPDYLLFTREQTLYARHLNLKTFLVEGEPKAVAEEVTENEDLGRAAFSAPAAGVLVYRAGTFIGKTRFTWRGGDGKLLGTVGEPAEYLSAGLSPDEKYSAFIIQRGGRFGGIDKVWIMDMASGALTPTSLNGRSAVVWSPDSLRLAVGGPNGLLELTLATGVASVVSKELSWVTDWFQDGLIAGDASAVYLIPATGDRKPQTVLRPKFRVFNVRVSPDGTRVAYVSNEAGINEVYIAAYPGFTEQRRVSTAGGSSPVWRKNGRVLFFLTPGTESRMMAAEVRGGERIEVGTPAELFRVSTGGFGRDLFSVARDGRFLIREGLASERDRPYIVIVNWTSELKQ